ncbi:MAG: hypothetical protein ACRDIB_02635 [Ardenticatenaceae bacterium]
MSRGMLTKTIVAAILLLLLASPTLAGGAAVVVLDEVPTDVHAGEPLHLEFLVRQHGQQPVDEFAGVGPVRPYLEATHLDSGESLRVEGYKPEGAEVGRFALDVMFPSEGMWEWRIRPDPFELMNAFEPLTVQPALAASAPVETGASLSVAEVARSALRWGGLIVLAIATVLAFMRWRRPARQEPAPGLR